MQRYRVIFVWFAVLSLILSACAQAPATQAPAEPTSAGPVSPPEGQDEEQALGEAGGEAGACTVKVAMIGPLTGDAAFWGNQMVQGASLGIEQVNAAGGIQSGPYQGCTYEIVGPFDDRGDPTEATNIAQQVTTMDDVLAVIGPVNSSNAYAILPILQEARIPVISGGASNPDLTQQGWDNFFRAFLHDGGGANFVARFMNGEGYKRIAAAYSNNDYGRGIFESYAETAKELGMEIVAEDAWQPGQDREFSPLVTRWQTQNPDAIFLGGEYTEAALIVKQVRLAGMEQPIVVQGAYGPDFLEISGEQGEGVVVQTMFDPFRSDETTQTFVEQFNEKYGENPAENGSIGYDAFLVLNNAMNHLEGEGREALIQALEKTKDFRAMNYVVTFDENGEMLVPDEAPLVIIQDGAYQSYTP